MSSIWFNKIYNYPESDFHNLSHVAIYLGHNDHDCRHNYLRRDGTFMFKKFILLDGTFNFLGNSENCPTIGLLDKHAVLKYDESKIDKTRDFDMDGNINVIIYADGTLISKYGYAKIELKPEYL